MVRSMILDSTTSCHLAQRDGVGGQLVAYILLLLVVPSCNYSNRFNEFDGIQTRNPSATNRGFQQLAKSAT